MFSVALISSTVTYGVGPFMENEGQPGASIPSVQGPNPDLFPPFLGLPPQRSVVQGEVLRIEGQYYVLRERSGEEVSLQVDNGTKLDIIPKLGDKIEADVTLQGHAEHIRAAQGSS